MTVNHPSKNRWGSIRTGLASSWGTTKLSAIRSHSLTLKAYKFRLSPTLDQRVLLNKTFGCTRFVWNKLVDNFNSWMPTEQNIKLTDKILKDDPEFIWLNEVSAAALQQKRIDFEETKNQYFNKKRKMKLGRPKFKKRGHNDAFRLPNQKFTLDQENSKVRLEKIGYVPIILNRAIKESANYRSITISKNNCDQYFASILVDELIKLKPTTGRMVGIDVGLKDLFVLSDGIVIDNPRWFNKSQVKLKRAQQHLARKIKGSNRRDKQKIKVAKIHLKIKNQRTNFLQEITTALVNNYDVIAIENLNVKGMVKNHNLAKAIHDASWLTFTSILFYKCGWYGKSLVKIDRWYPSSKLCHCCGHKFEELVLGISEWTCKNCRSVHHRDLNAAINIERKGYSDLIGLPVEFDNFPKLSSVEYIEYRQGEVIRPILFSNKHHLASSANCLDLL
jgi:putative transposase